MAQKTFTLTVDTQSLKDKFDRSVESIRSKAETIGEKVEQYIDRELPAEADTETYYKVEILFANTSGGTRETFTGTASQISFKLKNYLESGQPHLHLDIQKLEDTTRDESQENGDY